MAERLFLDEASGQPLPIYPIDGRDKHPSKRSDLHHAHFYRFDPRLQGEGGKAVRYSRLQLTPRGPHEDYHEAFRFAEIPLPGTRPSQFYTVVMALARYLPRQAVDVSGQRPRVVMMDDTMYRHMQAEEIMPQKGTLPRIGSFMMNFALEQDISHVNDRLIDEFIHTTDAKRQRALGHFLLSQALEVGVEPIEPLYREGWQNGLIPPESRDNPVACVQQLFDGHAPDYFPTFVEQLKAA